jgi:endoglucanase
MERLPMKKRTAFFMFFFICVSALFAASSAVRLNSIGFLPNNDKLATISGACTTFTVVNVSTGLTVLSGSATGPYSDTGTGENNLYKADFTALTTPGTYYLNVAGIGTSVNFSIAPDVYNASFIPIFKAMYLARCGTAVSETYNGNTFTHPACHLNDANNSKVGGTGTIVPSESGWHDAGDYNKYTVNAGITLGMLFMAWEQFSAKINLLTYGLPVTANGYPEFLEEIKWETDWLLTMQRSDGAVYDKVSETGFDAFEQPQNDTGTRYFWGSGNVGTVETATFCAMMAMAARNFQPYDVTYSNTCLNAAKASYAYLTNNATNTTANLTGCTTGDYSGSDPNQARTWAAVEMWVTTGLAACLTDAETRISSYAPNYVDTDFDWSNDKNLAMYSYVLATGTARNATLLANVQNNIVSTANAIVTTRNGNAYGRTIGTNYYWGCNGGEARQAMMLQIANQISPDAKYLNTALDAIGYLLGRNMWDRSFVTQIGINPPMNPHHRPSASDGITNPYPGYLVGGSPGTNAGDPVLQLTPSGLPQADYWADSTGSYSSNEVAINWQGALIYAMSGFLGTAQTPTFTFTPTGTFTPTATITGTPPTRTVTATITQTFTSTPIPTPGVVNAGCFDRSGFTLDGNLNDTMWQSGTWTSVTRVTEGVQGSVSAVFQVNWDATGIVVGVNVTDPTLCNSTGNWYDNNAVEIYIDGNDAKPTVYAADDYQFSVVYNENILREENGKTGTVTAMTHQTATGYSAEFNIPWSSISVTDTAGGIIGFDVGIDHNETCGATRTGVLMWNGNSNDWDNASAFGDCVMSACATTPTFTGTVTKTTTPTSTATLSQTPTFTFTATDSGTATSSITNTVSKTSTPTFTATQTFSATSSFTPTVTQTNSVSPTVTVSPTGTPPTVTDTPTLTCTPTVTVTSVITNTYTETLTLVPTFTATQQDTASYTPVITFTYSQTPSPTSTGVIFTPTFTITVQPSPSITVTMTGTAVSTPFETPTPYEELARPCPVNPLTQDLYIDFNLAAAANSVRFKVYTRGYRLIRQVKLGAYPAGMQTGKIDRNYLMGLSNGIYIYVIEASMNDGNVEHGRLKKFILLR